MWEKDLSEYSADDIQVAFSRHRSDLRPAGDTGRVKGEFWPMPAAILAHLNDISKSRTQRKGQCSNPECSSGWILAYTKLEGTQQKPNRYMTRCQVCHPGQRISPEPIYT
jgi:hypothetical protein